MVARSCETNLYEQLPGSRVRCDVCQWHCNIGPGELGVCRTRQNTDGALFSLNYGIASSIAVDPIEKKPLFHFFPASRVFSVGGWGCNFRCLHCQNWQISCTAPPEAGKSGFISPEMVIDLAEQEDCQGIAWTYNEPSTWFEFTLDSARMAKENGMYTAYVTNGYLTPEALDMIGPYLDAWRVDIKGFTDELYKDLSGLAHWRGILDTTSRARNKWNMHVEVITNIIPTLNDTEDQFRGIAGWIRDYLGELTPWHVTRAYPQYRLKHLPPTPLSSIAKAVDAGLAENLRFVYTGNIPIPAGKDASLCKEDTHCYSCGSVAIRRTGYQTRITGLRGSNCTSCGTHLNFRTAETLAAEC